MECIPFTQIGLAMDVIGVIMLFLFGYASNVTGGVEFLISPQINEKEATKLKRNKLLSIIGVIILCCGFGLQFLGSIIP